VLHIRISPQFKNTIERTAVNYIIINSFTIINSFLICPVCSVLHSVFLEMRMISSQPSVKYCNLYASTYIQLHYELTQHI